MSDENQNAEAAAEVTTSPVLDIDAAASLMASWGNKEPATAPVEGSDTVSEGAAKPEATPAEAARPEGQAEIEEEQGEVASEDDEFNKILFGENEEKTTETDKEADIGLIDWDKVPGNANFRLRDGTVVTAADLKRDWDDLRSVRETSSKVQAEMQEIAQTRHRVQQEAQMLAQVAPRAIAAIKASLPEVVPMPPKSLMNEDWAAYQEQFADHMESKAAYEAKIGEIRQIEQAQQHQQRQLAEAERAEFVQHLQAGHQELLTDIPALRDPAKRQEFFNRFVEAGRFYGFDDSEILKISDPRTVRAMKDAMAYRAMITNPPKPGKKATDTSAPVAAPGKRAAPAEVVAQKRQEIMSRVKPGMSLDEATSVFTQLEQTR